jgi:hypothetical protein
MKKKVHPHHQDISITIANPVPHSVKIIRWIARLWSGLVTVCILLMFFSPDSIGTEPIATVDILLISLTMVALGGLFIAWKWELVGGIFTITMLFIREIAYVILKGSWELGFIILWLFIAPPAILFLIAWRMERKAKEI